MFRAFEPRVPAIEREVVTLTVGECSPPARYASVRALSDALGVEYRVLAGAGHAAHLENAFGPLMCEFEVGSVRSCR